MFYDINFEMTFDSNDDDDIEEFSALEASDPAKPKVDREKTTTILKSAFYERVCTALAKKSNQQKLFNYIARYRNKYINILSDPLITDIIPFNHSGSDANIILEACEIKKEEMIPVINKAKVAVKLDESGKNITPFNVLMIMAMSYFYNDPPKLRMLMLYYACGFYYLVYSGGFKAFKPNQECMKYTVDNLTNKFILKQEGSLEKAIIASMGNAVAFYKEQFKRLYDYDICNVLIPSLRTRVSGMIKNVIGEYMKNYEQGNKMFTQVERNAEGEFIIDRESNIARIQRYADIYTLKFYSNPINLDIITTVANMHRDVSANELRTCITYIHNDDKSDSLKVFYQSIFTVFFNDYPDAKPEDVQSLKFLAAADAIYKKGNSKDINIINIKNISHEWLRKGSNVYKQSTRAATLNVYRKCIYLYFVMLVSNN